MCKRLSQIQTIHYTVNCILPHNIDGFHFMDIEYRYYWLECSIVTFEQIDQHRNSIFFCTHSTFVYNILIFFVVFLLCVPISPLFIPFWTAIAKNLFVGFLILCIGHSHITWVQNSPRKKIYKTWLIPSCDAVDEETRRQIQVTLRSTQQQQLNMQPYTE